MAYGFGGNGSTDVVTTTLPSTATTSISVACWVNLTALGSTQIAWYVGNSASNGYGVIASYSVDANRLNFFCGGVAILTTTPDLALSTSTWTSIIIVHNGSIWKLYADGVDTAIDNNNTVAVTPTGNLTVGSDGATNAVNGSVAEFAFWGAPLDASEAASLAKGYSPKLIRPASLLEYLPLVRDNISIKRAAPTLTGTSVTQHPRIIMPRRGTRWRVPAPAPPAPPETLFAQACL